MKKAMVWGGALLILFGFFWREYGVAQLATPLIAVEENVILFRAASADVFGMGNVDSPRARAVSRSLLPFFALGKISSVWEVSVGKEYRGVDFSVQRVSPNLARSICGGKVVWWIGEDFSVDEKKVVVQSGVAFEADWWAMINNRLPEFLPKPKEGIIFAGGRLPSKKTVEFAKEKELPLLSVSGTGGFMLAVVSGGEWELRVRD